MASDSVEALQKDEEAPKKFYKNKFFIFGIIAAVVIIVVLVVVLVVVLKDDDDDDDNESTLNTLTISYGKLQGTQEKTVFYGKQYYSFRGIRYATVPGRFQEAVPVTSWEGTYSATEDKPICIQIPQSDKIESEDCLFINVYTPKLSFSDSEERIPVLFWIYGGAFISGDAQSILYGPDHLLDEEIVLVSVNYRLGMMGFTSSGDERYPGNLGLKDIVLGLQWVQENIRYFGGDPKQVTIFGESAGGALVSYLTQSPLTIGKDYFIRAIAQSGSSLSPWSLQRDPMKVLQNVARFSGCIAEDESFDYDRAMSCLKQQDLEQLRRASSIVSGGNFLINFAILNGIAFAPVIEPSIPGAVVVHESHSYLSDASTQLVPMMIGGNSEEALVLYQLLDSFNKILLQIDRNTDILVLDDMYINPDEVAKTGTDIKLQYFGRGLVTNAETSAVVKYISDAMFNKPLRENYEVIQNKAEIYCYVFSYGDVVDEGLGRAGHAFELPYLFHVQRADVKPLDEYGKAVSKKMTRMWANYAKYGNPTPSSDETLGNFIWPKARQDETNVKCLNIDIDLTIVDNPFEEKYRMWKDLYTNRGHPKDTY